MLKAIVQFIFVLVSNVASTIPVAVIGIRFAMSEEQFWKPTQYSVSHVRNRLSLTADAYLVPVVGMLCGNTISGIVVAVNYVLAEM